MSLARSLHNVKADKFWGKVSNNMRGVLRIYRAL